MKFGTRSSCCTFAPRLWISGRYDSAAARTHRSVEQAILCIRILVAGIDVRAADCCQREEASTDEQDVVVLVWIADVRSLTVP